MTIYNYFGSKEQLTHDTVIYYTVKVWNHYKNEVFNRSMPYIDKMNAIVFDKKEIAANTHKEFYQYIMDVYQKGDYINRLYTEEILPTTMAFLEEGKKLGYVNPSISNEAIMIYIEMYREYFLNKPAEQLLPYTDELIHLFRYGLAGKKES